jgi:arylsulfatase A-like enzyme
LKSARRTVRAAAAVVLIAALSACSGHRARIYPPMPELVPVAAAVHLKPSAAHPNIVFVLTDDLSSDLVEYMPHVRALEQRGMTFTNYTVTDSLCCPSRASIFTGEFPHNTGVRSNLAPDGGYPAFARHHDGAKTFAVALEKAGYLTGFEGKYLNSYDVRRSPANQTGWDFWEPIGGGGYFGYHYSMSLDGKLVRFGADPSDYANYTLGHYALRFVHDAVARTRPFMLEVASYSPHAPSVPAPRDRGRSPNVEAPRTPRWNTLPTDAPPWLAAHEPLDRDQIAWLDHSYERRVEAVQSVDRMIGHIERELRRSHQFRNTVFVFSSDNGYHMGDYTLTSGKMTAFDTDINVPLVVAGPGIEPGSVNAAAVENIDLAPTFEQLAGVTIPKQAVDGHSFVPLLHGRRVPWRTYAGIEHLNPGTESGDPDRQRWLSGHLPSYTAVRTAGFTYVVYANGEREFYDRTTDPWELHNTYAQLSAARVATLNRVVRALTSCRGYAQCWQSSVPAERAS